MTPLDVTAAQARRLILDLQGLADPPHRRFAGGGLPGLIERMGFVQIDSIQTVARAHHTILHSRNRTYRPAMLAHLLERDRSLFEHWTHDAAAIPTAFYPVWRRKFRRDAPVLRQKYRRWHGAGFEAEAGPLLDRIAEHGPVRARDFAPDPAGPDRQGKAPDPRGWWDWHAGKAALEFLWRTGELAVTRRENFQKVYDLSRRVLPAGAFDDMPDEPAFIDWACRSALDRLGFGTAGEIAGFWGLVTTREAEGWLRAQAGRAVIAARVAGSDRDARPRLLHARADLEARLAACAGPPAGLRLLSPFDPLVRDRRRLRHLFGFDYRIEIFVAAPKRRYGYYVFPLLEADRTVGRIDMTADRPAGVLRVRRLWLEPGIRPGAGRLQALERLLARIAAFADCREVAYADGWI